MASTASLYRFYVEKAILYEAAFDLSSRDLKYWLFLTTNCNQITPISVIHRPLILVQIDIDPGRPIGWSIHPGWILRSIWIFIS